MREIKVGDRYLWEQGNMYNVWEVLESGDSILVDKSNTVWNIGAIS